MYIYVRDYYTGHKDALCGYMTCQNLNNFSCKWKCKERGSKVSILLLFMCAMEKQYLTSHVTTQRIFVVVLTN